MKSTSKNITWVLNIKHNNKTNIEIKTKQMPPEKM